MKRKPKPFCCPGGVSQGLPIPSAVLQKVSCFICSSEEVQSEGLGSLWGSVCFPLTINARFPIVGGVWGFAGQIGGASGRWWELLFHLPGSTEGCCILHDHKAIYGAAVAFGGQWQAGGARHLSTLPPSVMA